jgi:hypothetical protein
MMEKSHKRSQQIDEILSTEQAASILGINPRLVRDYIRRGVLKRVEEKGKDIHVMLSDVASLASVLATRLDFARVAQVAMKALVTASQVALRIRRIEALLGIDSNALDTNEEAVIAFYQECVDIVGDYTQDMPADEVLNWAYRLSNITEDYISLAVLHTGNLEPWQAYLTAAQKLYDAAPREAFRHRKDLEVAYGYIAAARRHIRQVVYFYLRSELGARNANRMFPELSGAELDEKIIDLIFMMRRE